jgi:putative membrane protein
VPSYVRRVLPLLVTAASAALLAGASIAVANGRHHRHPHHHGHHKRVSAWDKQWLMMSIEGDRFEIQGGKLAQQKGTNPKVRDLGARLVKDHSESLAGAVALAHKLGVEVPDSPSPSQQWELRVVSSFSGGDFDRWYADLEVQDHMQDIQEATDEVNDGTNHKVRKEAKDEIPVLQEHLQLAKDALASS